MKNLKTFAQVFENQTVPTVKFQKWTCVLNFEKYQNDRTAIELVDKKNGEPVLMATVNLPDEHIAKDEVIIKNYSENEGILDILVKAKIISEPLRYLETGHVKVPVCKLLVKPA